jgi:hypothetical protein
MYPEVDFIIIKNKVVLSGLVKSGTAFQQPKNGGSSRKRSRLLCRPRHLNLKCAQKIYIGCIALEQGRAPV